MKWIGSFGKLLFIAVLASAVSVGTTFLLVSMTIERLLEPYQAVLPENKIEFSEFVGNLWNPSNILGREQTAYPTSTEPVFRPSVGESAGESVGESAGGSAGQSTDEPAGEPVMRPQEEPPKDGDQLVMSDEQFLSKRDQLSEEDRMTVFSLLVTHLPQEELQRISTALEDGLTAAELEEVEMIVERYLPLEQYEMLIEIIQKYETTDLSP